MRDVTGNLEQFPRSHDDVAASDRELQRTADDKTDLLVFMRVHRHDTALPELEPRDGDAIGSDVLPRDGRIDLLGGHVGPAVVDGFCGHGAQV